MTAPGLSLLVAFLGALIKRRQIGRGQVVERDRHLQVILPRAETHHRALQAVAVIDAQKHTAHLPTRCWRCLTRL